MGCMTMRLLFALLVCVVPVTAVAQTSAIDTAVKGKHATLKFVQSLHDSATGTYKVTPDGKVKVLDFGLAKAWGGDLGASASSAELSQSPTLARTGTLAGVILGTAAYMSPEQASGKAVDKRADIWAFGVVLFEMLSGRSLFTGETASEVMASVIKEEPAWDRLPASCPLPIAKLLRRCLRKRSRERLQDIGDARIEIQDVLSGPSLETQAPAGDAVPGTATG